MNDVHDTTTLRTFRRTTGVEVVPVPDGYVVYDDAHDRVHYLNPTAAIVLELCDLCPDEAAIAKRLQSMFDLSESPDAQVDACLTQLLDQMLVIRN